MSSYFLQSCIFYVFVFIFQYYIKSYNRVFPEMNSFLTTLSQQPIISTIGVNPDLLQFYISTPNDELNFMTGNYQHYYVSGVVTSFSLERNYVSFQLPSFHYLSRDLYYRISPSCIQNHQFLPDCSNDADILMQYAYTIEVEEIPYIPKSLIRILVIYNNIM